MQGWSWQSIRGGPASRWLVIDLVEKMDAYRRAANYLSVGQVYLKDNPLLDSTLKLEAEHCRVEQI
jgi:phosphoketolase